MRLQAHEYPAGFVYRHDGTGIRAHTHTQAAATRTRPLTHAAESARKVQSACFAVVHACYATTPTYPTSRDWRVHIALEFACMCECVFVRQAVVSHDWRTLKASRYPPSLTPPILSFSMEKKKS